MLRTVKMYIARSSDPFDSSFFFFISSSMWAYVYYAVASTVCKDTYLALPLVSAADWFGGNDLSPAI